MNMNLEQEFLDFVASDRCPCVGAKLARASGGLAVTTFGPLGAAANDHALHEAVGGVGRRLGEGGEGIGVHTLAVLFDGPDGIDEAGFERLLWAQLQRLHELDVAAGTPWAADVASDPAAADFSMSLAGHPFFVVGLHPGSSRRARRFKVPVLVFNSHRQFARLRREGRFEKMQAATRRRDTALQGSINPMLADHGEESEARQYSGRRVGPGWRCPFHARSA